jgi:hypothetical protein
VTREIRMAECRGLWGCSPLIDGDGCRDNVADVCWLQGITAFVELRKPQPGAAPNDGFAGWLSQTGDVFTWARLTGLQRQEAPDEGRMSRTDDVLVETGVHADYVEHWVLDDTAGIDPCWALGVASGDEEALLLRAGMPQRIGAELNPRRDSGYLTVVGAVGHRWQIKESEGSVNL